MDLVTNPICVPIIFLILLCFTGQVLRSLVITWFSEENESTVRKALLEFEATFEYCVAQFELALICQFWGMWVYAGFYLALTVWYSLVWMGGLANTDNTIEEGAVGAISLIQAAIIVPLQLLAAMLAFSYIRRYWDLGLIVQHLGRGDQTCKTDLKVTAINGALIEGVGTLVCSLGSKFLLNGGHIIGVVAYSVLETAAVLAGLHFTGGYYNPLPATSLKLECTGHTRKQHFIAYWLGPIIASLISLVIYTPEHEEPSEDSRDPRERSEERESGKRRASRGSRSSKDRTVC